MLSPEPIGDLHTHAARRLVRWLVLGVFVAAPLPAQQPPAPAAAAETEWKQFDYTCQGGAKLTVYLHNETVKVLFNHQQYLMRQVIAASGTRYSDGKVVWWSKGEGGFLQQNSPTGNGEMIVKDCQLNQPLGTGQARDQITGTVSYRVRSALPPEAIIQVRLEDVSRTDAPATLVAEDKIVLGPRQVPVPFELKFDPAKIDPRRAYAISASIVVEGQLRFVNERAYRVLTQGHSSHVEMNLKPADANAPTHP